MRQFLGASTLGHKAPWNKALWSQGVLGNPANNPSLEMVMTLKKPTVSIFFRVTEGTQETELQQGLGHYIAVETTCLPSVGMLGSEPGHGSEVSHF